MFVEGNAGSEMIVRRKLIDLVSHIKKGRVIISCFASNVARLESCALAAQASGRQAVLVGRSMIRMDQAARANGYLTDLPPFLKETETDHLSPEETLLICTGSQGEPRSALTRMALKTHPKFKLQPEDTVLFSARMIPGNEEAIRSLQENLMEQNIKVLDGEGIEDIHVSGHPGRADLKQMYAWIRPQILVPVHGRLIHMREQASLGKACGIPHTIVPRNGTVIRLSPEGAEQVQVVKHGRMALDGSQVVPLSGNQMRDRHQLMVSGVLLVTLIFDKRNHLREEPQITQMGVFEDSIASQGIEDLQDTIVESITTLSEETRTATAELKETVRLACRRRIMALRKKKPVVVVHIVR